MNVIDPNEAVSYRTPMEVTHLRVFRNSSYYMCPRCKDTMEREFVAYCDRCGQCLDWENYENAILIGMGYE